MLDQVLAFVHSMAGQTTIAAIVCEAAFRLIKTDKPLSIAHLIAEGAHKVSDIIGGVANFLDKVLPQGLK